MTMSTAAIKCELQNITASLLRHVEDSHREGDDLSVIVPNEAGKITPSIQVNSGIDMGELDRPQTLPTIRAELENCRRCELSRGRTNVVFGEGNEKAELVFVGEGPGEEEDISGRPFVGRAGQLLDKIIAAMNLKRDDVYICNVVKCRPPGNRAPREEEIITCEPFLARQIATIKPRVICALGSSAARTLLKTDKTISLLRGNFATYRDIPVMPTFHPAYLLRNPGAKKQVWSDVQMIMQKMTIS